jgi:hypothetical protein
MIENNNKIYDQIMNSGLFSFDDESGKYFSHDGCDVCAERTGKRLGNDVYDANGYLNFTDAKNNPESIYKFKICGMCLNTYANNEPFED